MVGISLTFIYNLPFELLGLQISKFFLYFGTVMAIVSGMEYYKLNKKNIFTESKDEIL